MNNLETLRFGFVRPENGSGTIDGANQHLFVDVPTNLFLESKKVVGVESALELTAGLLDVDTTQSVARLTVLPKLLPAPGLLSTMPRKYKLGHVLSIFDALDKVAHPDNKDPLINISLKDRIGQNHANSLRVRMVLPDAAFDDATLSATASAYMQNMARQLQYKPEQNTDELVKAVVTRISDIRLQANSKKFDHALASDARVDTSSDKRLLVEKSLHNPERKFICIAGAVAIAHAAELLS